LSQVRGLCPNPYFKVTPLSDVEYLRNGTIYIITMEGLTRALLKDVISNDLE